MKNKITLSFTESQFELLVRAVVSITAMDTDPLRYSKLLRKTAKDLRRAQLLMHLSNAFEAGNNTYREAVKEHDKIISYYEQQMSE